jgi:hypothetical protein
LSGWVFTGRARRDFRSRAVGRTARTQRGYAPSVESPFMRAQVRLIFCGVILIAISVASIVEPPGTATAILYGLVIISTLLTIQRERRKFR